MTSRGELSAVRIRRATRDDIAALRASDDVFDHPVSVAWAEQFFAKSGHHMVIAEDERGTIVGFATGIEMAHPDKGTELMIYELGVAERVRSRGLGTELVTALVGFARELGFYGVWTATEPDNEAALATYRRAGANAEEATVVLVWQFANVPADTDPPPPRNISRAAE